jgi:hypothetical protein
MADAIVTRIKFILDFDGVLFNSAYEAFTVANRATRGRPGFRQDISYEEFLAFRSVVTDAWHYNRLYATGQQVPASALRSVKPDEADWAFARDFFAARKELMENADWPKGMPPYDFFFLIKPLLLKSPDSFAILSTRNVASLKETLTYNGVDVIEVFGQENIREAGSKVAVARSQGWLDRGEYLVVYVDDMNSHLEPFEGEIHLPLHADWGYDRGTPGSLSANQIHTIISSLLTIAQKDCE